MYAIISARMVFGGGKKAHEEYTHMKNQRGQSSDSLCGGASSPFSPGKGSPHQEFLRWDPNWGICRAFLYLSVLFVALDTCFMRADPLFFQRHRETLTIKAPRPQPTIDRLKDARGEWLACKGKRTDMGGSDGPLNLKNASNCNGFHK